jgi:L,D-transpeptidase YcbB
VRRVILFGAFAALLVPFMGATSSWANELQWTGERTAALLKAIRSAGDHGLDPDWYGANALDKAAAAGNEQALTNALVAYATDVSTGRVNANSVDADIRRCRRCWPTCADNAPLPPTRHCPAATC